MKIIGTTTNPFVNIAINIANNKENFDKSSFQLIDFLLEHGHAKEFDLNEQFLVHNNLSSNTFYSSQSKSESYSTNFFNTVFILDNSFNPKLINKLVEAGLKINPFLIDEHQKVLGDILFTQTELNSDRNIFLFNLYLKQNGIKDFTEKVVQHNTLNRCIAQKQLDTAAFLLKHVSVDLQNNNLETPIMFSRNIETLEFLSAYNPSWGQKSALGNDCSFYFSGMQDDKLKQEMLNFYVKELSKDTKAIVNDAAYVEKRLEETLIQLVTKDATKAELHTFLKKYKLKNADTITNKDNRTLGHICVSNEDFPRFSLFPKTDLYHIDNNGYNIFTTLFNKSRYSSETKLKNAKALLLSCLQEPEKNISQETFNRLVEMPFSKYSSDILPAWILKDHFLRSEVLKTLKLSPSELYFGEYINSNKVFTSSEQNTLYFDMLGNLIKEFDVPLLKNDKIFDKIFNTRTYSDQYMHYFNEPETETIFLLLKKCANVGKINLEDFLEDKFSNINSILFDLQKTFMVYNKEQYESSEELEKVNQIGFYTDVCNPFFKFLAENRLFSVIQKIDENLVTETLKIDEKGNLDEFSKTFSYLKLNNKLTPKNIKTNSIKI